MEIPFLPSSSGLLYISSAPQWYIKMMLLRVSRKKRNAEKSKWNNKFLLLYKAALWKEERIIRSASVNIQFSYQNSYTVLKKSLIYERQKVRVRDRKREKCISCQF